MSARKGWEEEEEQEEDEVQALVSVEDEDEEVGYSSSRRRAPTPTPRKRRRRNAAPPHSPTTATGPGASNVYKEEDGDGRASEEQEEEVVIYTAKSFVGSRTWDGIDVNGHRAAEELRGEISRLEGEGYRIAGLSIMGYSLGGLIARYLIGHLSRSPEFWDRYPPRTFSTAATPHLGQLKYGSTLNTILHTIGKRLFSRTGQQLFALDKDSKGRCLLEIMAEPQSIFVKGLQRFPKILIVANGCNDRTVPYPTASISTHDPFVDHELSPSNLEIDQKRNLVLSWTHSSGSIHRASSLLSLNELGRPGMVRLESKQGREGILRVKPAAMRVPPILVLKWPGPFKYTLFLLLPFVIPLWLCFVSVLFTIHTIQSSRRITAFREMVHHAFHLDHDHDANDDLSHLKENGDGQRKSPSKDRLASLRNRPSLSPESEGAATPVLMPSDYPPNRIPLLLTERQKRMVHNLERALPKMERLIAWYPWIYNTHATLILRDVKRFPFQEEGRPVLRAWAEWVVS